MDFVRCNFLQDPYFRKNLCTIWTYLVKIKQHSNSANNYFKITLCIAGMILKWIYTIEIHSSSLIFSLNEQVLRWKQNLCIKKITLQLWCGIYFLWLIVDFSNEHVKAGKINCFGALTLVLNKMKKRLLYIQSSISLK